MPRALIALLALVVLLTAGVSDAFAHKIKLFATAQGTTISGTAYLPGGGRIAGAEVTARDPDGTGLATAVTDDDGAFSMEATRRVDHLLDLDTGDGHRATFRIAATQLPPTLPGPEGAAQVSADTPAAEAGPVPAAASALSEEALEAIVARAVAAQLNPLREQMDAREDRARLQDILGGLGWIMGLTGIAFFLLARKERRRGGG